MNLFGLEGSGFLLSICLTLFLSGMIVFYVRQSLNEQNNKLANMLSIIQGMNSIPRPMNPGVSIRPMQNLNSHNISSNVEIINGGENINETLQSIKEESSYENDKIDVSDDEDSEENSTTDDSENEDFEVEIDDNSNIVDITENNNDINEQNNNEDNVENDDDDDDDDGDDDDDDDDDQDHESQLNITEIDEVKTIENIKEIVIDPTNSALLETNMTEVESPDNDSDDDEDEDEDKNDEETSTLDEMLFDLIKKAEDNNKPKLTNLKVSELRQLIKDKNIKVNNLSKLKKDECIELLS